MNKYNSYNEYILPTVLKDVVIELEERGVECHIVRDRIVKDNTNIVLVNNVDCGRYYVNATIRKLFSNSFQDGYTSELTFQPME